MNPKHRYSSNRLGMTLVELMVVVAIIVLLGSIMIYFIAGNRAQNAQSNMTNDILALINDQRARAIGLNVASYIIFDQNSVHPKLGKASACTTVLKDQLDIRYNSNSAIAVALDYGTGASASGHRTLDSSSTEKYYNNGNPLVRVKADITQAPDTIVPPGSLTTSVVTVCFQPNGFVFFMKDGAFDDSRYLTIDVFNDTADSQAPNHRIAISALGAISRLRCSEQPEGRECK